MFQKLFISFLVRNLKIVEWSPFQVLRDCRFDGKGLRILFNREFTASGYTVSREAVSISRPERVSFLNWKSWTNVWKGSRVTFRKGVLDEYEQVKRFQKKTKRYSARPLVS
ncbi:MAG TPA: hypothetical protein DCM24_01940 [Synergistaceae bacterium]|nr:hypothetical protein [Synergistaceae bacterium]